MFPIPHIFSPLNPFAKFGEGVAFYFAFLVSYTALLLPLSLLGLLFAFLHLPYSPVYSSLLALWSLVFVESWRIRQRALSVRWSTRGIFRVEKRRTPEIVPDIAWWQRELRTLASIPVIALFAAFLFALLTAIFVFEAFVSTLYTGPGHQYIVSLLSRSIYK
jgi:anoctamin-10